MTRIQNGSRLLLALALLFLFSLACDFTSAASSTTLGTPSRAASLSAGTESVEASQMPADTETPTMTLLPSETPSPTETPQPSATFTVMHTTLPDAPGATVSQINDIDSSATGAKGYAASGDDFQNNRFERPFLAEGMVYLPEVDLSITRLSITAPWVYATFQLANGTAPNGAGTAMYGLEIDTDQDGRGNYLVWGLSPANSDWTTDGVEIWMDSNKDVGGSNPQLADTGVAGDGYDQNIFRSGQGSDPDMAWIRKGTVPNQIQLAFKYSAIQSAPQFFWNALADAGMKNPAGFDPNDHFTAEEAGSPLMELTTAFPLKKFFGFDNTCVNWLGAAPAELKPWHCAPLLGTVSGTVFWDQNKNGEIDSGDLGTRGMTIIIRQGSCTGPIKYTDVTDKSGKFYFSKLLSDTYCLTVLDTTALGPPTTPNPATIFLGPGESKKVLFGFTRSKTA
jgi:hypothetical protein